jgi:hypothetical protein
MTITLIGAAVHETESSSGKSSINQTTIFPYTRFELNNTLQVTNSTLLTTAKPLWDAELLN